MADLIRGAYADSIEHALAATALQSRPSETIGVAALAAAYGGDLDQARELSDQMTATATSPTLRGFAAYVACEIDSASGRREQAEEHYARAIDLARSSGATFLDGIATVGLLTQRVDAAASMTRWAATATSSTTSPHRQLDPPVDDLAQPRPPAAPARRPRTGDIARCRRRPGTRRTRHRPHPDPDRHQSAPLTAPSPTATPSHQPSTRPRGGPGGDRAEPARAITRSLHRAIPPVVERPSLWKWLQ